VIVRVNSIMRLACACKASKQFLVLQPVVLQVPAQDYSGVLNVKKVRLL